MVCREPKTTDSIRKAPVAVLVDTGKPPKKYEYIFVANVSYYSRLRRVMVTYNPNYNTLQCPCANVRLSCPHKYNAN